MNIEINFIYNVILNCVVIFFQFLKQSTITLQYIQKELKFVNLMWKMNEVVIHSIYTINIVIGYFGYLFIE